MKTDVLFYELFKTDPRSLFELVNLEIEGDYAFESITVKTTEKRFDGFFKRTDGIGPNIFLEIQGYDDNGIYWRSFREVCTWYEQIDDKYPFIMVILFIDEKYDPGDCPLLCAPPNQMIRTTLAESLETIKDRPGVLTVLKPFALSDREKLPQAVSGWKAEISDLNVPEYKKEKLMELLEYFILQCFPKLTLKEVQTMIRLTPLEKTVAGQELINIGREEGIEKGLEKGELIGKIQLLQEMLKCRRSSKTTLVKKSNEELKVLFEQLKSRL